MANRKQGQALPASPQEQQSAGHDPRASCKCPCSLLAWGRMPTLPEHPASHNVQLQWTMHHPHHAAAVKVLIFDASARLMTLD